MVISCYFEVSQNLSGNITYRLYNTIVANFKKAI